MSKQKSPTFNNIKNPLLRDWNRCAMFFNLIGDEGMPEAKRYVKTIPEDERKGMWDLFQDIKERGYDRVRASVNRSLQSGGTQ